MNRTTPAVLFVLWLLAQPLCAQDVEKPAIAPTQAHDIDAIAQAMQAAEAQLTSARIEIETSGRLPGGVDITTRGILHVLRGAQPALRTSVEFAFGDGITGRMEASQTAAGITIFEDNPAFGEILLHIEPAVVADLEWAGQVLEKSDLPGMADRRANSPLGSSMLADLRRHFDLAKDAARKERLGEKGKWLIGKRRAGLDDADPELPLADRVELFVRDSDQALVEVKHLQNDKLLQHIVIKKLELGLSLPASIFVVEGRGQQPRTLRQYQPMRDLIEKVLAEAEAKSEPSVLRPSQRK